MREEDGKILEIDNKLLLKIREEEGYTILYSMLLCVDVHKQLKDKGIIDGNRVVLKISEYSIKLYSLDFNTNPNRNYYCKKNKCFESKGEPDDYKDKIKILYYFEEKKFVFSDKNGILSRRRKQKINSNDAFVAISSKNTIYLVFNQDNGYINRETMGIYLKNSGEYGYIRDLDTNFIEEDTKEMNTIVVAFSGLKFYFDMLSYYKYI